MAGLSIPRVFTKNIDPDRGPFSSVEWERRDAVIMGKDGSVVVKIENFEVPKQWSQRAGDICATKYARRGDCPKLAVGKETSVREVVWRIARKITDAGADGGYFASNEDGQAFYQELVYILLHQYAAFNSPVWFNVGLDLHGCTAPGITYAWKPATQKSGLVRDAHERPPSSACFILKAKDDLMEIMGQAVTEARLFKYGSGAGSNFSAWRSKYEKVSGGGTSSGVLSFLGVLDKAAGSIKSGGTTRRAAKLVVLDIDHPDVEDFIDWKVKEERKAKALIAAGYDSDFNGEAYATVGGQNANNSVRITDAFMRAVEADADWDLIARTTGKPIRTVRALDLWKKIVDAAWECADPGLMFDDTIQKWHTVPNFERIFAANPCNEFHHCDNTSCNLASTNLLKFLSNDGQFDVDNFAHVNRIMFIAQEILVGLASYPTPEIAENSYKLRPLGLGYANLGSLLMMMGMPYDSDEGRGVAAAVTSLQTANAYATSAEMAKEVGAFEHFAANKEPMIEVMKEHFAATCSVNHAPLDIQGAAEVAWDSVVKEGERYGFRNSQATVTAPTGCLVPGSLVQTSDGLVRIEDFGDTNGSQWQSIDVGVQTDEGMRRATKFFVNGIDDVIEIRTASGYVIRGTPKHQIKIVGPDGSWSWIRFGDVAEGAVVPLMMNSFVGDKRVIELPPCPPPYRTNHARGVKAPGSMSAQLAELVGIFHANGSLHQRGLRFSMFAHDRDAIEKYAAIMTSLFGVSPIPYGEGECTSLDLHSTQVRAWWQACGFAKTVGEKEGKGFSARIPDAVLATNDPAVYGSYLRGLFTGDGCASGGVPSWTNKDEPFVEEVRTTLLALGVPTRTDVQRGGWSDKPVYRLHVRAVTFHDRFMETVGFSCARKAALVAEPTSDWAKADFIPLPEAVFDACVPIGGEHRKDAVRHRADRGGIARHLIERMLADGSAERNSKTATSELRRLKSYFYDEIVSVRRIGRSPTYDISVPSNVTYVANGFVSHNTIGLMMDCSTTGCEPDFALVKWKTLAGGGYMRIVNETVFVALKRLGYGDRDIAAIRTHILGDPDMALEVDWLCEEDQETLRKASMEGTADTIVAAIGKDRADKYNTVNRVAYEGLEEDLFGHGTIEGCSYVKVEHLPIFDCANRCGRDGKRFIEPMGHIRMLEATAPFLSGAASKTANLPHSATREDVSRIYMEAWKRGIKCVALYRDGCKASQPLSTQKEDKGVEKVDGVNATDVAKVFDEALRGNPETYKNALPEPFLNLARRLQRRFGSLDAGYEERLADHIEGSVYGNHALHDPHLPEPVLKVTRLMRSLVYGPPRNVARGERERLPTARRGITQEVRIAGQKLYLRTGEYADGRLGEIFLNMHKQGSTIRAMLETFAISVSIGLQHGVPLEAYVRALSYSSFEPAGMVTGDEHLSTSQSLIDFVVKKLGILYGKRSDFIQKKPKQDGGGRAPVEEPAIEVEAEYENAPLEQKAASVLAQVEAKNAGLLGSLRSAIRAAVMEGFVPEDGGGSDGGPVVRSGVDAAMDGPPCPNCSFFTVRNGACWKCMNCAESLGCS